MKKNGVLMVYGQINVNYLRNFVTFNYNLFREQVFTLFYCMSDVTFYTVVWLYATQAEATIMSVKQKRQKI